MIKNYIKIAIRNLLKDKFFSLLKLSGLVIGLVCFLLISLYIQYEYSYDRHYPDVERIYQAGSYISIPGRDENYIPASTPKLAPYLLANYPGIENASRVMGPWEGDFSYKHNAYHEDKLMIVDSQFVDLFSIQSLEGSTDMLAAPNNLALTRETAQRYFGDESPVGKTIKWGDGDYTVCAVVEKMPETSSFDYDFLISYASIADVQNAGWGSISGNTYVKLHEGAQISDFEQSVSEHYDEQMKKVAGEAFKISGEMIDLAVFRFYYQNIRDVHIFLQSSFGSETFIKLLIFIVTAGFLLLLACINFVNLSSASSLNRSVEIGLRKATGASRKDIVIQFLFEAVVLSLIGLFVALPIVKLLVPYFSNIVGSQLVLVYITPLQFISVSFVFSLLLGIIAGSFPAFVVSAFPVLNALKGNLSSGKKSYLFRKSMVAFQLVLTFFIMFGTYILDRQFNYMITKDLGYDKENVLVLKGANKIFQQRESIHQELMSHPEIKCMSFRSSSPGMVNEGNTYQVEGKAPEDLVGFSVFYTDQYYAETYGLELVDGRFLTDDPSDSLSVVLNEKAVRECGLENPVGKHIIAPEIDGKQPWFKIVGVLKDYNFESVKRPIEPLMIRNNLPVWTDKLFLRYESGKEQEVLAILEDLWSVRAPGSPFDYTFLDESLNKFMDDERVARKVLFAFSLLTIFISCLGILGLISYTSAQRTKEIGIRKANGATIFNIVMMLTKGSFILSIIAIVIASPLSYLFASNFLSMFPNAIQVSALYFMLPAVLLVLLTFSTESIITIKAARMNPVKALRYE